MGSNTFRFPGSELENEWDYTQYPMTLGVENSAQALANLGTILFILLGIEALMMDKHHVQIVQHKN